MLMITIKPYDEHSWSSVWRMIEPVFRSGDTYAFSPEITEQEAYNAWIDKPKATYVATDETDYIVGTYYIKPNQPSLGAHVCNCGYIVDEMARGKGIASSLCKHSQVEAVNMGFRAMQYNLVVATNEGAIRLWKKHGFNIIGVLPKAFNHKRLGFVDALVMYKELET